MLRSQAGTCGDEASALIDGARNMQAAVEYLRCARRQTEVVCSGDGTTKEHRESGVQKYVRMICDGGIGYYATNARIKDVGDVLRLMRSGKANGDAAEFQFAAAGHFPDPRVHDESLAEIDAQDLSEIAASLGEYARSRERGLTCDVSLGAESVAVELANSNDLCCGYSKTAFSVNLWLKKSVHGRAILNYDKVQAARAIDARSLLDAMLDEMSWSVREAELPVAATPRIVLAPALVSYLIQFVVSMASANLIALNGSCFGRGSLGDRLFDERMTIVDDGLSDWQVLSAPFDDEGEPCRRRILVEKGVLAGILSDRQYAARLGLASAGSFKYVNHMPSVSCSNISLMPGTREFSGLLDDAGDGLLVGAGMVQGDHQGNFVMIPQSSYLVSHGEVAGCIRKTFHLAGNVFSVLNSVVSIGARLKLTRMNMHLPYVVCAGLRVV